MSYPFEYRQNYINDKDKFNLQSLKRVIAFNYDMIQVPNMERRNMCKNKEGLVGWQTMILHLSILEKA